MGDENTQEYITSAYLESLQKEFSEIAYFNGNGNGRASILDSIDTHLNGYDPSRFSVLFTRFNDLPGDIADALVDLQIKGVEVNGLTQYSKKYLGKVPVDDTDLSTLMNLSKTVSNTTHRVKRILDFRLLSMSPSSYSPLFSCWSPSLSSSIQEGLFYSAEENGPTREGIRLSQIPDHGRRTPRRTGLDGRKGGDSRVTRVGRILRSTRMDEVASVSQCATRRDEYCRAKTHSEVHSRTNTWKTFGTTN